MTLMKPHPTLLLAVSLLCGTAFAADHPARFTLDVKIDGSGHQAKGKDHSQFTTVETMHAAFTLIGSGVGEDSNRLNVSGNAATMQKQVNEANARAPSREQQQQIMEQAKARMAACNGNMGCMQAEAQKLGKVTSAWSVRPASPGADAGRFLTYATPAQDVCKAEFQARLRNNASGEFPDVQGLVPFTNVVTADFKANQLQATPLCTAMIVLDTRSNTIFVHPPLPEVRGKVVRTEGSRTMIDSPDTIVSLNRDALDWVAKQLQDAPKSGTQRTTLKIPTSSTLGGVGEKIVNVEMTWKFDGN